MSDCELLETWSGAAEKASAGTDILYGYDAFGRLQSVSSANNRTGEDINGGQYSGGQSIRYFYNGDDQLYEEIESGFDSSVVYDITHTYDANGNLKTQSNAVGLTTTNNTYTYDLRNRMITATINNVATAYGYDTSGIRISEITGSSATFYLNDPNNPTGYTKAIEESTTVGGSTTRSYVFGLKVEAQSDATNGTLYLLTDGHGSTRALINVSGSVIESYDYDAYGKLLETIAKPVTNWLFGGDGLYDPASGWTYHLARWTNGFWFTQADGNGYGNNADPISLHKYLYANADPINGYDPSGHGDLSIAGLLVAVGITFGLEALFSPNVANAPLIGGPVYRERSGDQAFDALFAVALAPPLKYLGEYAISPLWRYFRGSSSAVRAVPAAAFELLDQTEQLAINAKFIKPVPGYTDVVVHGTPNSLVATFNGVQTELEQRSLATFLKANGYKGGPIRLISCSTGVLPDGVAKNLANKLGETVIAPNDTILVYPNGALTIGKTATSNTGKFVTFNPG